MKKSKSEWTYINTRADIPDTSVWDTFEWECKAHDSGMWFTVHEIKYITITKSTEPIYRYKLRHLPPDEWIEERLWKNGETFCGMSPHFTARSWFLTAEWVLKDIHKGYTEC